MSDRKCPSCGASVLADARFCSSCGTKLEQAANAAPPRRDGIEPATGSRPSAASSR